MCKLSSISNVIFILELFLSLKWSLNDCYLLITSGYLVFTSGYLVVTSGYLIVTTGYFLLLLVPRFSNNDYPVVLLASDFYYIFLCCGIALKIELSCKFPTEFCNLRCIQWTIHSTPTPRGKLPNSLLIISKGIESSNYLNN